MLTSTQVKQWGISTHFLWCALISDSLPCSPSTEFSAQGNHWAASPFPALQLEVLQAGSRCTFCLSSLRHLCPVLPVAQIAHCFRSFVQCQLDKVPLIPVPVTPRGGAYVRIILHLWGCLRGEAYWKRQRGLTDWIVTILLNRPCIGT